MTSVEEVDVSTSADVAARASRSRSVTARAVRAECRALLAEADAEVSAGRIADLSTLGATLHALAMFVHHDESPVARLTRYPEGGGRHRSGLRVAERVAVETERERLGAAQKATKEIHEAARSDSDT